ncbi:hypothetical protein PT974_10506 [Cladobotryum mycophilum]|uniref:Uncharacterized protein n=1 Tax=Cladobotryum mycophilum TaxID=491253 RepID=A0ABR0SA69_9HYPO
MNIPLNISDLYRSYSDDRWKYNESLAVALQKNLSWNLKNFLSQGEQPTMTVCFLVDLTGNPNIMVPLEQLVQNTNGVDPFSIPNGTPPNDPRVVRLTKQMFNVAVRFRMGLPPGIRPEDLPDVVELGDTKDSTFRLFCSKLTIVQNTPQSGFGIPRHWDVWTQPFGEAWYFDMTLRIRLAILGMLHPSNDPMHPSPVLCHNCQTNGHINNFVTPEFDIKKIWLSTDNDRLILIPSIEGMEGTNAEMVLINHFFDLYRDAAKEKGLRMSDPQWPEGSIQELLGPER